MFLLALKKKYEAEEAEHTAVVDTFLQKSIGVADHDNFMQILKERFDKLTHVKCCLKSLNDIIDKANEGMVNEKIQTKDETKTKAKT